MGKKFFMKMLLVALFIAVPVMAMAANINNGGFEFDFDDWLTGESALIATIGTSSLPNLLGGADGTTTFNYYDGSKMASIGSSSSNIMGGNVSNNFISQEVMLEDGNNYLNLVYIFWTYDEAPFDNPGFLIEINDKTIFSKEAGEIGDGVTGTLDYTNGNLDYTNGNLDGTFWTGISIDVSKYISTDNERPASIDISFLAGNSGDNLNPSGVFLDDISITSENIYKLDGSAVPIPGALLLFGSGVLGLICIRRK